MWLFSSCNRLYFSSDKIHEADENTKNQKTCREQALSFVSWLRVRLFSELRTVQPPLGGWRNSLRGGAAAVTAPAPPEAPGEDAEPVPGPQGQRWLQSHPAWPPFLRNRCKDTT